MPILVPPIPDAAIVERTSYYIVEGATESELVKGLNSRGPTDGAQSYWAITHAGITWSFDVERKGAHCFIAKPHVFLGINIVYPTWTPPVCTQPQVFEKWTTMITAIVKHEHEHAQFGREAAGALVNLMRDYGGDLSCSALDAHLKKEGKKILDRQSENDRDLDARTQHGASEGVAISW